MPKRSRKREFKFSHEDLFRPDCIEPRGPDHRWQETGEEDGAMVETCSLCYAERVSTEFVGGKDKIYSWAYRSCDAIHGHT